MNSSYVYTIFDLVGNSYSPVFESKNDKTAVRDVLRSLHESVDKRLFCDENELLCICKLDKVNSDDESKILVHPVDCNRTVDWPVDWPAVKEESDG